MSGSMPTGVTATAGSTGAGPAPAARIDVHTHLVPALAEEVLAVAGLGWREGRVVQASGPVGPADLYDVGRLLAWLDEAGLDRALVSVPPPLHRQGLSAQDCATWVRGLNDGLESMLSEELRLDAVGYLPLEHPGVAAAELRRLGDEGGWQAFTASAGGASVSLSDGRLDPLWELVEELDVPLLLHPGASPDSRLDEAYLHNLLGNPVETAVAAAQLLIGGVLSRHPRLRIGLVHGGGVLPAVLGRLQKGVETSRPGLGDAPADLRSDARRLWSDCLTHDERALGLARETFGDDHLLIGSDWPFPMGAQDPVGDLARVDVGLAERAAEENGEGFLGR